MLTRQLRKALVKAGYARFLTLGAILGVAAVIVVLSLFANYYRAAQVHLTGIHPHISLRKQAFTSADRASAAAALAALGEDVVGYAPALDLLVEAEVIETETTPVVCAERGSKQACYDFAQAERMRGWSVREATGFSLGRSRVGPVRVRGIAIDEQGKTLLDLMRILDVRTSASDLLRLTQGAEENMPPAVLFERTFFHGAAPLDDFLLDVARDDLGGRQHVRLLSTFHLGLKRGKQPVVITSLEQARQLLNGLEPNAVDVRLRRPEKADKIATTLKAKLAPAGFEVRSWQHEDAGAFRLLGVLGTVIATVVSSAVVIAALSIASTLSLVVIESRRSIAMLRALGLRDHRIFTTLFGAVARIAGLGLAGGTTLGVAVSALLLKLPGFRDGLAKMGIGHPEVLIEARQLATLAVLTLATFLAAAWAPARAACRIDPVEGLTR